MRSGRVKPRSGISTATSSPVSTARTPAATSGSRRSVSASGTATASPSSRPTRPTWAPRVYPRTIVARSVSSASQASSAPLRKVHPAPQTAIPARTASTPPGPGSSATTSIPVPITSPATTRDSRRLTRSATIPVGTSRTE